MSETDHTPVQQDPKAEAPASPVQQAASGFDPDKFVEKERFSGAIQKIQSLTSEKDRITAELNAKNSELEQLRVRLAEQDAGSQALVGQRDKNIEELTQKATELERKMKAQELDLQKVKLAREIGRPDLIEILDTIPSVEDPEAMKTIMQNIAGFADTQVKRRETELLSGVTPGVSSVQNAESTLPKPDDATAWEKLLNNMDPYSKEYAQTLQSWGEQLHKNP